MKNMHHLMVRQREAVGVLSIGGRPYQEDRVVMHTQAEFTLYAVFDGHGGDAVAQMCKERVVPLTQAMMRRHGPPAPAEMPLFMAILFDKLDAVAKDMNQPGVGCTAVIVLQYEGHVVCANCGDSMAIFGSPPYAQVLTLTQDHKVENEISRLTNMGASITRFPGDTPRINSGLNLARSIGDHGLKPFVSSRPWVNVIEPPPSRVATSYVLLASDGVWDVMGAADVHQIMVTAHREGASWNEVTRSILRRCRELRSSDNVSIVIAPVRRAPQK